ISTMNPRARRITLRVDPVLGQMVLVIPRRASAQAAMKFVASRARWIEKALAALPPRVAFADGTVIPVHGVNHTVRLAPDRRGGVWRAGQDIVVTGHAEHAPRRLREWL